MPAEVPQNKSEKKETLDDNARKFTMADRLDPAVLAENGATSYALIVDWLKTDKTSEKKVVYKEFANGDVQILLITKVTKDGQRTSVKEKISEEKYRELTAAPSVLHLEKQRYEFTYQQNGTTFSMKYDEFPDSELRILEVDTPEEERRDAFDPDAFPTALVEVTGDIRYYGYRVASIIH